MHFGFALHLLDTDIRTYCLFPRRLEEVFKTCLQEALKTCLQDVFKTCLQNVFKICLCSSHLEDIFSITTFRLARRLARCLQDVFKTFWNTKYCYAENLLKMPSRRLEDRQTFAGLILKTFCFM